MSQVIIGDILPYTQAVAILNQTVFGTNWTANYASDVVVYQTPSGQAPDDAAQILAYPSTYSVAFIGDQNEVQVTLVTGAAAGDIITITRQTPADRMNLYSNTNFTPSMLNTDFGILTLVDQQAQLVNQLIAPRYNYSADITDVNDTILPVLTANEIWVKNSNNTAITTANLPEGGIAPANGTFVLLTADTGDYPNSFGLNNLSAGILVNKPSTSTIQSTSISGTSDEIAISNGDGIDGDIVVGLASDAIVPGTAGMGIPNGTTEERVIPGTNIALRYNTDLDKMEYYNGAWVQLDASAGTTVTSIIGTQNQVLADGTFGDPQGGDVTLTLDPNIVVTSATGTTASFTNVIGNNVHGGNISLVGDAIQHIGDTNNQIIFGTDTQDFQNNGSSIMDISASGLRLGAANSRVTTILNDGTMAANSATALATQQSIKTYADTKFNSVALKVITSSSTYTPTAGMVECIVEGVGAGGGGGGCASTSGVQCASGNGGAAGGAFMKLYTAAQIGASAAIVIGTLGAGGVAGANNGSAGTSTTFTPAGSGVVLTATGGAGGNGNTAQTAINVNGGAPATGGMGTNGDINVMGQSGSPGVQFAPTNASLGGAGGSPPALFGTGGATAAGGASVGNAASGYGGGGGGAANGNTAVAMAGGNGTPGLIIITEYIAA